MNYIDKSKQKYVVLVNCLPNKYNHCKILELHYGNRSYIYFNS